MFLYEKIKFFDKFSNADMAHELLRASGLF